ncbi:MAG: hypothetical protein LBQ94_07360 [Treponema sp.]|jgi:hypothetical protein|nr:hypothetical protein [Treponema sp.]
MTGKNAVFYLIKTLFLCAILFGVSKVSSGLPPVVVIICCILLCVPNAETLVYLTVIRKTSKARHFQKGGWLARFNNGKFFCIIFSFCVSLAATFAMFLEMPAWGLFEWLAIIVLFPVYLIVYKMARGFLRKEVKSYYLEALNLKWCMFIVPVIMCVIYFACDYFFIPRFEYQSITEAFIDWNQKNLLASSPSALVADAAKLTALFNAFSHYVIGRVSGSVPIFSVICNVIIYWAIFCNITNILNWFTIPKEQQRHVITPLTSDETPDPKARVQKKYIVLPVFLAIISVVSFLMLDNYTAGINRRGHFTRVETFIRETIEVLVVAIDDKYYQYEPVVNLIRQVEFDAQNLQENARRELVPMINRAFDARLANVDSYLDWYYSLPADYARLGRSITGTLESYMEDRITETLNRGVDDSVWLERADYYSRMAEQLYDRHLGELEKLRLDDNIPDWLVQPMEKISMVDFTMPLNRTREMLNFRVRLGISAGVGITAGVVSRVLIQRLVQKQVIQKLTAKLLAKVGTTVTTRIAAGAAVGAAGGAIGGPIGMAIGALIGIGVSIGVDYALIKVEEAMERDEFREELVRTIEEQRQAALAFI